MNNNSNPIEISVQGPNYYNIRRKNERTIYLLSAETCSKYGFLESLLFTDNKNTILLDNDGKMVPLHSGLWNCPIRLLATNDFHVPLIYSITYPFSLLICFFHIFENWRSYPMCVIRKTVIEQSLKYWNLASSMERIHLITKDLARFCEIIQATALCLTLDSQEKTNFLDELLVETTVGVSKESFMTPNELKSLDDPLKMISIFFQEAIHRFIKNIVNESSEDEFLDHICFQLREEIVRHGGLASSSLVLKLLFSQIYTYKIGPLTCLNLLESSETNWIVDNLKSFTHGLLPDAFLLHDTTSTAVKKRKYCECNSDQDCLLNAPTKIPWIKGVILAGSFLIQDSKETPGDIDLFVHYEDVQIFSGLMKCIYLQAKKLKFQFVCVNYKNVWTLVFVNKKFRIQIILDSSENPMDLIHRFDLDCIRCFYCGQESLLMFPECYLARKDKCIYQGNLQVSEHRTKKIMRKGYRLDQLFSESQTYHKDQKDDDLLPLAMGKKLVYNRRRTILPETEKEKNKLFQWFYPGPDMSMQQIKYLYEKAIPDSTVYLFLLNDDDHDNKELAFFLNNDQKDHKDKILNLSSFAIGWNYQPEKGEIVKLWEPCAYRTPDKVLDIDSFLETNPTCYQVIWDKKKKDLKKIECIPPISCNVEGQIVKVKGNFLKIKITNENQANIIEKLSKRLCNVILASILNNGKKDPDQPDNFKYPVLKGFESPFAWIQVLKDAKVVSYMKGSQEIIQQSTKRKRDENSKNVKNIFREGQHVAVKGRFTQISKGIVEIINTAFLRFSVHSIEVYHNLEQRLIIGKPSPLELLYLQIN